MFLIVCLLLGAQTAPFQPRTDLEHGRFLKVLAESEAILKNNDSDALAWAAKSQVLSSLMQFDEARSAAQCALDLQPGLADALVARATAKAGKAVQQLSLNSLRLVSQTMDDLKEAVKIDPDYALAWATLGLGYQQLPGILGGSTKRALECADKLRRIQPARGDMLQAQILSMEGKWGEAEPIFLRALKASPRDAEIVYYYLTELAGSTTRKTLGEAAQKRKLVSEAQRLRPFIRNRARGVEAVSHALMVADRHEDSWRVALEALPNVDAPSIIKLQLGKVAARTGINREEGLAFLDQAANEPIEGGTGGYASVHWRKGQILKELGRTAEARDAALKALTYDPYHRGSKALLSELS